MSRPAPLSAVIAGLCILVAVLFAASLLTGPAGFGAAEGLRALFAEGDTPAAIVMQEIRLPRALLGLLIGAILGLSGAVLQGLLRNPLAEPGIVGVTSTASLGAVVAIYTGLSASFALALPLMAMGGALAAVVLIGVLAARSRDTLTVILAGVAVTTLAGALTSLALNLAPNPFAALEIVFWMLGSLADRSVEHVHLAAPFILAGGAILLLSGRALDALSLGEDVARTLGVDMGRARAMAIAGTALGVGAATAVAGAIGFVGLVVPHLLRPLVGARPSRLLVPSALGGAALLLAADVAVRVILPARDLKLGVLTALVGVPFFFALVLRTRREGLA
ncbi:FecCD family ABC transporter permease [Futiania mangrovi]|uniref:Iron ABC transporter permease n=1 Tax=Futiania mangrovi TaxID=2959716 RepID=A0A9J6PK27_9PROT|nr:iron ABC transporter permease [Futiania mangrovii]MCP1336903.1 iron ABC transporter permease [Futiania mangrovii]